MAKKITEKNKGGRPLKFKTVKELQEKIDAYFESCHEPIMDYKPREGAVRDPETKDYAPEDYEWVHRLDYLDRPLYKQIKPYTVSGLAIFLDTTRETLLDYENKYTEFSDTIKKAKQRIEEYAEEYLFTGKNQTSAIFNLKNNWGWKDKTEVDNLSSDESLKTVIIKKSK